MNKEQGSPSNNFVESRRRNVRRILDQLTKDGLVDPEKLSGLGFDLGAYVGASTSALEDYGAVAIAVEQSAAALRQGLELGLLAEDNVICETAEIFLTQDQAPADFITFFGISDGADIRRVTELAEHNLQPGGFFLLTTMPELEEVIDTLPTRGTKFKPNSQSWWDSVGYLLTKSY